MKYLRTDCKDKDITISKYYWDDAWQLMISFLNSELELLHSIRKKTNVIKNNMLAKNKYKGEYEL